MSGCCRLTSSTCAVRLRGLRQPSPCILTPFTRPASNDQVSQDIEVLTARHSFSRARSARQVTFSSMSAVCKAEHSHIGKCATALALHSSICSSTIHTE